MIRSLWNLLYGEEPREFVSSFSMDESIARLSARTGRPVFFSLTKQMAVGRVTESRVSLQRVIPRVGNSFKPFFVGCFVQEGSRVLLRGRFTMSRFTKVFMSIWFGLLGFSTALALMPLWGSHAAAWWFPFFGLGMFSAGVALVWVGKWLARNDAAWLSQLIESALSGQAGVPAGVRAEETP